MPPRWPRKPDRQDPAYRRLDDRMNLALHIAIFAATNSALWFVQTLHRTADTWAIQVTGIWLAVVIGHAVYILAIARYAPSPDPEQEGP